MTVVFQQFPRMRMRMADLRSEGSRVIAGIKNFCRLQISAALALGFLVSCSGPSKPAHEVVVIEFFGPPVKLGVGTAVRVDGLLRDDVGGDYALFTKSGAGMYSQWDCVVLRDISWLQEAFLPSLTSDYGNSYQVTGTVVARGGTFGRGDGFKHGPRECLYTLKVESFEHLDLPPALELKIRSNDVNI